MHCSAGSEIRQILQGVTEWIASMVDDQADPFGDLASFEQSGEMSSITAHVAEVISQMAGTLNDLGANEDMDVEITYEFDLAVRTHTVCVWSSCLVYKRHTDMYLPDLRPTVCACVFNQCHQSCLDRDDSQQLVGASLHRHMFAAQAAFDAASQHFCFEVM